MDLAYVDKILKDNKSIKYLMVRQDLFDRTVVAKEMNTKDSRKTIQTFLTTVTKSNWPAKIGVDKGTEFARECKKTMQSWRNTKILYNEWD